MAISPGQLLKNKREEKQIPLEQAAQETNIRIQYLQAIEEDRIGAISSQAQLRGFIRLYASYLGINPLEVFELDKSEVKANEQVQKEPESNSNKSKVKLPGFAANLLPPKKEETLHTVKTPAADQDDSLKASTAIFKSIGADLQQQREELGLSRYDIERQIKIRELYIHALENGLIDDLPSSVQGRGMLNNYAAFMNLDPEPMQMRFAEGLQQRRLEKAEEELAKKKSPELKKFSTPITGWRRYLTPDLLIGGGVFAVLFILIIWGALQVIGSSQMESKPTAGSISDILIGTDTPAASTQQFTPKIVFTTTPSGGEVVNTASVDLLSTISAVDNKPIQLVVVAYQRAYLKVVADGKEAFLGRTVPGVPYPFSGTTKITLSTGNAAALQVYYNQQDLGILGSNGQAITLDFTGNSMLTATPQVTELPTATLQPTYTQQPTQTPTITPTPPTPTVTPYKP